MKNKCLFFCLLCLIFQPIFAQKIKTAVYWTSPVINETEYRDIAKFDLAIIDVDNFFNNAAYLDSIKKLNPHIKLICYSNPMEIFDRKFNHRPLQGAWTKEILTKYPQWLLKDSQGKKVTFYEGMRMLNMSSNCPKVNGQTYSEWMADLLIDSVLTRRSSISGKYIWDGYFQDNCTPNISWVNSLADGNDDGVADLPAILDQKWSEGNEVFLKKIRTALGKDFILIGNKGTVEFMNILNGRMFENFPNNYLGGKRDGGWYQSMANAEQTGLYTIFQVSEKNLKLGIGSAKLLENEAYVAVGQNNKHYYPEFDFNLGDGGLITISREFQKGRVDVSPAQKKVTIFINK